MPVAPKLVSDSARSAQARQRSRPKVHFGINEGAALRARQVRFGIKTGAFYGQEGAVL